jgi:predicted AAA+ superfamily ATPase
MNLQDVLLFQKRELELRLNERYVPRELPAPDLDNDLIKVILGPRRAGKSFFAVHLLKSVGPFGYVNFDDERLAGLQEYDALVAAMGAVYQQPRFLLLDEVQNLPQWELFVSRLQRQGYRLVVTGSNAHLLSRELATHLTGRHVPILVFPFSFGEFLSSKGTNLADSERSAALLDYLQGGGFPEPLLKRVDGRQYLSLLLDAVLYKDIVRRAGIRSVQGIAELTQYLLTNVASEYSFQALAGVTNCRSAHTVQKYVQLLEEAFLVFSLKRFSFKAREQVKANRKIYCVDNGFMAARGFLISQNLGKMCENAVAVALKKREMRGEAEVFFWKSQQQEEVDFVVKRGPAVTSLIQVCWDIQQASTKDREIRALVKGSKELHCEDLLVLTQNAGGREDVEWFGQRATVRFVPLWKWLLNPNGV